MANGEAGKNENSKQVEEVGQGEESDEYVYGRSSQQAQGEAVGMRRSSRQPKPRFANLSFELGLFSVLAWSARVVLCWRFVEGE